MENWNIVSITLNRRSEEEDRHIHKNITVDSNGNLLEEIEYDMDSNILYKKIYRYFDTGGICSYTEIDHHDELIEKHTYTKDDYGYINKIVYEYGDGSKQIQDITFTDLGDTEKVIISDENGDILGSELYILNEHRKVKEMIELDADNNETAKHIYRYNDKGDQISEEQYIDNELYKKELFEYDINGNIIKRDEKEYSYDSHIVESYKYDNNNNQIHSSVINGGILIFENKCEYDDNNELLTEEFYELSSEGKIISYEKLIHERNMN
jgi:hypothetical protein